MLALSIRQPWAWLILHAGKNIENRDWPTKVRGRVLVHASKGMTIDEWLDAWEFAGAEARQLGRDAGLTAKTIERGGIVGSVEIANCVTVSDSRWFIGRNGFVLRDPQPLPFVPWKGRLGFFDIPESAFDPQRQVASSSAPEPTTKVTGRAAVRVERRVGRRD